MINVTWGHMQTQRITMETKGNTGKTGTVHSKNKTELHVINSFFFLLLFEIEIVWMSFDWFNVFLWNKIFNSFLLTTNFWTAVDVIAGKNAILKRTHHSLKQLLHNTESNYTFLSLRALTILLRCCLWDCIVNTSCRVQVCDFSLSAMKWRV